MYNGYWTSMSVNVSISSSEDKVNQVLNMAPNIDSVVSSIEDKLRTLPTDCYTVCIYNVPEKYHKANEDSYKPRLVSIGPLHHGKTQLQAMEVYKLRCLQSFLERTGHDLRYFVNLARREEYLVCGCYEDTTELRSEVFLEMILLDGVFVIEVFLKNHFVEMREQSDVLFKNQWMSDDLLHDMLLLENQLPLRFVSHLFDKIVQFSKCELSVFDLAREYFQNVGNTGKLSLNIYCSSAKHLVEFLIYAHSPSRPREPSTREKFECGRSAIELQKAGIKFSCGNATCIFDVTFCKGELVIPKLVVNDSTKTFFRNLIAFEHCRYLSKNITSYVIFMGNLINTSEDVELLVRKGIIENAIGESVNLKNLFNNLHKEIMTDPIDFYFAKVCGDLNHYYRDYWHQWRTTWFKWKVILRRDYFGNPWSLISIITAVTLLILSVTQTVCCVFQHV